MQNKPTKTVVTYVKNGVTYSHTFPEVLLHDSAEAKMITEHKVGRSAIKSITNR